MPSTTPTLADSIVHAEWCLPRIGEAEPRTETYRHERTDGNGRVLSRPLVARCLECGEQQIQG